MTVAQPDPGRPGAASPWREAALGLVFLVIGLGIFALARAIEIPARTTAVSPRAWPEALGIGIAALSLVQVGAAFFKTSAEEDTEPATALGVRRVAGFVLAVVAFGFLWYFVHFLVSGMALVAGLTWIAGGRGIKDLLVFPAAVTVLLYGLFALLLKVPV